MTRRMFKILDTETGLYSTGGCTPRWNHYGKTWNGTGQLTRHLALVASYVYRGRGLPSSWVIVTVEQTLTTTGITADDFYRDGVRP